MGLLSIETYRTLRLERIASSFDAMLSRRLNKIDARYGGLAAPRSVDLAARIDVMN